MITKHIYQLNAAHCARAPNVRVDIICKYFYAAGCYVDKN